METFGTCLIIVYFLPSIVAMIAERRNVIPIIVVNFCFGWCVLGWFIALIWALIEDK